MKNFFFSLFVLMFGINTYSQENGKWEAYLIQKKVIRLDAGNSHNLSIELPLGTTKVFYTIRAMKLVGEKDELSIISKELSKSPLPNFAVLATETTNIAIGMSDAKISYSINSQSDSNNYNCYNSEGIVTNERVYIDYTNKNCLDISGTKLKLDYSFKSENKYFGLKVVLEVIPFVDIDLKRGWSQNIKNLYYENLVKILKQKNNELKIDNIDELAKCLLNKMTEAYTLTQFELLADYEKNQYLESIFKVCRG